MRGSTSHGQGSAALGTVALGRSSKGVSAAVRGVGASGCGEQTGAQPGRAGRLRAHGPGAEVPRAAGSTVRRGARGPGRVPGKCAPLRCTPRPRAGAPGTWLSPPMRAAPGGRSRRSRLTDLTGGDHGLFSGTECVMSHITVSCPRGSRLQAAEPPCTGRAPTASGHTRLQPEPRAAGPAPPPSAHASPGGAWSHLPPLRAHAVTW